MSDRYFNNDPRRPKQSELSKDKLDSEVDSKKQKNLKQNPELHFMDTTKEPSGYDPINMAKNQIASRESEYQARHRNNMTLSPTRFDPFAQDATPSQTVHRTFASIGQEEILNKQKFELERQISKEQNSNNKNDTIIDQNIAKSKQITSNLIQVVSETKSDTKVDISKTTPARGMWAETPTVRRDFDSTPAAGGSGKYSWEATPAGPSVNVHSARSNRWDVTPQGTTASKQYTSGMDWEETPKKLNKNAEKNIEPSPTPGASKRKSRWDVTPNNLVTPGTAGATPTPGASSNKFQIGDHSNLMTPGRIPNLAGVATPLYSPSMTATPTGLKAMGMMTPSMTNYIPQKVAGGINFSSDPRFRAISEDEINAILPKTGYKIHQRPANYIPLKPIVASGVNTTPTPLVGPGGFFVPNAPDVGVSGSANSEKLQPSGDLPNLKTDDLQYFGKLLKDVDTKSLSSEESKERQIMELLLKVKNGTPQMRKSGLREITRRAQEFGPGPLFNQILPLLMSPTLEDQERHLMVKVIDRLLYKLDDQVRPYVHKILIVIEPMLIDEDYYARVEGREIISNLAKAAGLATMIATMRPDIDNSDEYVRNTTARAFAVVASSLGVASLLPFLKAVCKSTKSWQARHTGIKTVQQIAILMGCSILPNLRGLVEIIEKGLEDEELKVRIITALAIAALAEAATPYGIESFDSVLKPLWTGIRTHKGKSLAALLKAIGYLIPLMDAEYAFRYTCEVMSILVREFNSPDEEMKKVVMKVIKQCCSTDGIEAEYIKSEILPPFFRSFWNQRMALDKRNYQQLVDTTVEIASKVGGIEIINRIVDDLKDDSENFRKMVMETIERIVIELGIEGISHRLEEQLIDGCLYSYQEQISDDVAMLNGFGAVVNALGVKSKAYLPQISGTVLWRLNNTNHKIRQQAADLIAKVAPVMKLCQEDKILNQLGLVLFEYLGEEYPEVLGSIISGLKSIVSVVGMEKMKPPIKDILPRLTPILKNRHEKVQENCVELVGRIADRGAEHVSAKEWMRICFELLELLKAHKKAIRRATVNTFGYIAKAIGPHDVLIALLNNLKVQERQLRVAIAIVAETCSLFTVLPALMNEYRVPDINVQHGVLKTLSFMFEYIGEMAKDYIYAVIPLLEDALIERDIIHRQTAMFAIGHLAVGVAGFGNEDALIHILNLLWPNILETSPHVVQAFMSCIDGMRIALGPGTILLYCLQGLFHPARRVREAYWRVYNNIYIGSQDSLTPFYPRIFNDENNTYVRYELDYIL